MQQQEMSPEAIENQKIDQKVGELQQKRAAHENPAIQSPEDTLKTMLMPQKPKLKPVAKMKVLFNNGEMLGEGKVVKGQSGGTIGDPYGSKKTRGLNPHKVIMGQGSAMMGNGNVKKLDKNPRPAKK